MTPNPSGSTPAVMPEVLADELLTLFSRGVETPLPDAEFHRLALAAFAYQFARNPPYAAYCRARGRTPECLSDWRMIPAVPTAAFKEADLTTVPPEQVRITYLTSGTSRGGEKRGRHLLPGTELYDASLLPNFAAHLLPDRAGIRMLVCGPTARFFPQSSLGHMHSKVLECFGESGSGIFWREDGPRFGCLAAALVKAEADGAPLCLLGTAFGFVLFLDWLAGPEGGGRSFRLPRGSRLMDTGGYKGRSREVPKTELYAAYHRHFGIPLTHIVNEYGMTELGSQFYDRNLRDAAAGRDPTDCLPASSRIKLAPPWVRVVVVDPETLEPLDGPGPGLLRFIDLANLHTVLAVQTDDLGELRGEGFEILGRAASAEARGCSLTAEEFAEASGSAVPLSHV